MGGGPFPHRRPNLAHARLDPDRDSLEARPSANVGVGQVGEAGPLDHHTPSPQGACLSDTHSRAHARRCGLPATEASLCCCTLACAHLQTLGQEGHGRQDARAEVSL
jgi:hypothetical protein